MAGIAVVESEGKKQLCIKPELSDDPAVAGQHEIESVKLPTTSQIVQN